MNYILMLVLVGASASARSFRQPNFTPEDCAAALMAPSAWMLREAVKMNIARLSDKILKPLNTPVPVLKPPRVHKDFALYELGSVATELERNKVESEATYLYKAAVDRVAATQDLLSTPLTEMESLALGVDRSFVGAADELELHLSSRAGQGLRITATHFEKDVGSIELPFSSLLLGFHGSIPHWVFTLQEEGLLPRASARVGNFIKDNGAAVLIAERGGKRFAYKFSQAELRDHDAEAKIQIDIFVVRECAPEVAWGGELYVASPLNERGKALCFASTNLRLITPLDFDDEDDIDDDLDLPEI